jgi:hypothetical protein
MGPLSRHGPNPHNSLRFLAVFAAAAPPQWPRFLPVAAESERLVEKVWRKGGEIDHKLLL